MNDIDDINNGYSIYANPNNATGYGDMAGSGGGMGNAVGGFMGSNISNSPMLPPQVQNWHSLQDPISVLAIPRVMKWTNGQGYPVVFDDAQQARNFVKYDRSHEYDGSDIMDDARGAWPQGAAAPIFMRRGIHSNADMRVALGEAYLDRNGLNSLPDTDKAIDTMLLRNPHLLVDYFQRGYGSEIGDIKSDVLLRGLSSETNWPWFGSVYHAARKDLAEITRMEDWTDNEAGELLNRYARWQIARGRYLNR